jgi:predicted AlkP superfamily pyrophosphatase or phosphodiesterase
MSSHLVARFVRSVVVVVAITLAFGGSATARPRLAVVIVVDQMRADYLTRFAGLYTGGFRRFLREGAVFTDAHHDHALTVTAAGHATISTGAYPSHHGIVGNEWYDRALHSKVYCTDDSASPILGAPALGGQSPRNLRRAALGDWLKAASPSSRVFSVAFKDRSAIQMGGMRPDAAFWYDGSTGRFVTSAYYAKAYAPWVDAFNASGRVDEHFAEGWRKLLPEEAYFMSTEDRVAAENDGEHTTFPYSFDDGAPDAKARYHQRIWETPFGDELTVEFAEALVASERLGDDADPDVLWLSCSTADLIGHRFGPLSQEAEDCYLRLDRELGELFAMLDAKVGPGRYVAALTADHGVLPLPEELDRRGVEAARVVPADFHAQIAAAVSEVARASGLPDNLLGSDGYDGVVLNGPASAELRQRVAERLRRVPFVADAYTLDELEAAAPGRAYLDTYRRSTFDGRTPDVMLRYRENYLVDYGAHGTSHGSPYAYDTHVPLVFFGAGVRPGDHADRVFTVDLAPTIADLLGVQLPADADGRSLRPFLHVRGGNR